LLISKQGNPNFGFQTGTVSRITHPNTSNF
jgi:hypothetical protein